MMRYLLVCDLDDTLTGDKKAIRNFNAIITSKKFCLAYSSGRYKSSISSLIERTGLVNPEVITANLGTEIYYAPNWNKDKDWEQIIKKSWNKEKIISGISLESKNKLYLLKTSVVNPSIAPVAWRIREIEEHHFYGTWLRLPDLDHHLPGTLEILFRTQEGFLGEIRKDATISDFKRFFIQLDESQRFEEGETIGRTGSLYFTRL